MEQCIEIMPRFDKGNTTESLTAEWLLTNGTGAYASSTLSGANTRRYHGLLVASFNPPVQRRVLVSRIEETIQVAAGEALSLASNFYPGVVHPAGYLHLLSFERDPLPSAVFEAGGCRIRKTIFMVRGANCTVVEYENTGRQPFNILFQPFYVNRDYHTLQASPPAFGCRQNGRPGVFTITSEGLSVFTKYSGGTFQEEPQWHRNNEYPAERGRGFDFQEDTFTPGTIEHMLASGSVFYAVFTTDPALLAEDPAELKKRELDHLASLAQGAGRNKFEADLRKSADQFIVWRQETRGHSLLAGYHWFTDWGRDTMIAMQGLCIALQRQELSKSILATFLAHVDDGMIPNRFADDADGLPEYNTIDASLWCFVALLKYYRQFGDAEFIKVHSHRLEEILLAYIYGTRYGIRLTAEGFIAGGEGSTQLTWMDARIGDYVVTPRHGCAVEIQALWYNALRIYIYFAEEFPEHPFALRQLIEEKAVLLEANFPVHYINKWGYLSDVVGYDLAPDDAIRPNQIYALSLPFPLLKQETGRRVLETVDGHLFTPFGLRTLSPADPRFAQEYRGDAFERDSAYHQGTVWPFLLIEYFRAFQYIHQDRRLLQAKLTTSIAALKKHFYHSDCVHGMSEIFDGRTPRSGKGAVHQAWSLSSLIQMVQLRQELNH